MNSDIFSHSVSFPEQALISARVRNVQEETRERALSAVGMPGGLLKIRFFILFLLGGSDVVRVRLSHCWVEFVVGRDEVGGRKLSGGAVPSDVPCPSTLVASSFLSHLFPFFLRQPLQPPPLVAINVHRV